MTNPSKGAIIIKLSDEETTKGREEWTSGEVYVTHSELRSWRNRGSEKQLKKFEKSEKKA